MSLAPLSLTNPEDQGSGQPFVIPPSDYPLHLDVGQSGRGSYWWRIIAASLAVHAVLLLFATKLPSFTALTQPEQRVIVHSVPLYIPRDVLTQRAPNKREVTKQVDLADLLRVQNQRATRGSPDRSVRQFEMPKTMPNKQNAKAPVSILPEAPAVAMNQTPAPPIPGAINGLASAPPPPTPSSGPFQNIGTEAPPPAHPKIQPPKATVQAAVKGLAQSANGNQTIITDDSPTQGVAPTPGVVGEPGAQHAGVELKSDPQGADMRPYLARILSIVRANWQRVIPPGVRAGTLRGRTVLEFIINRDGSIPKLVIADSSGQNELDLPAVHALSASNPLPPLPADFKGDQVRLAFSFTYNMATR